MYVQERHGNFIMPFLNNEGIQKNLLRQLYFFLNLKFRNSFFLNPFVNGTFVLNKVEYRG